MKYRNAIPHILASSGQALAFALAVSALITGSQAATRNKQDNADALNVASSWDTLPGAADIAQWGATVTAAHCSAVLGADLSWAGIKIVDPGDLVTIAAGNTLTIGTSGIDLSTATQNLTIASGLTVLGKQSWKAGASRALDVAGPFTRNGATVDFTSFDASATLGTLVNETSGILGPWATTGSTTALQYVTSTGGLISAYAGATPAAAADLSDVTSDTTNYTYGAATTLIANQSGNTLRYTGGAATTALGANGLTLNGLLNAGSGALTITSTTGNPGLVTGASGELDIISNSQTLTLGTRITGTGKVVYNAAGNITFGAASGSVGTTNNYSGGTVINGTTEFRTVGAGTFFGTGPVTVNGGLMFISNNTLSNDFTFNGGLPTMNNSFASTLNGTITLAVTTTWQLNQNGNMVINGKVTGPGGLTKTLGTNNGPLQLANANNDYAGLTTVNEGILQVKSSLYGNDTSKWKPANISVASGATFALNIGGASDFSLTDAGTMLTNLLTSVSNNGLKAGSLFGLSTANATAPVTFATTITDSSGTGGGAVGLRKLSAGTLELTGANTYSGKTRIDAGTLSVNNIANVGAVSSALGAPTTAANGAISIGHIASAGTLRYTGTAQSTDRTIQIGTNSAAGPVAGDLGGATIQNDGTGALTFSAANFNTQTSATSGAGANRTLTLQGNNVGTISGIIQNNLVTSPATGTANVALTKAGVGTWVLGGANTYTGVTTVTGGALVLANATAIKGGIGVTGGLSALTFNGGVIGLGDGNFTRSLAAAGTVSGATFTGNGGWAAYGADRTVNLGGASASIPWGTASTGLNSKILILGNATATHTVDFQNPLDLGAAIRTVQTDNGGAAIDGTLSGIISGAGGGLTKTGAGTLVLTANNDYTADTTVSAGTLKLGAAASIATSASVNLGTTAVLDTTAQSFALLATQPITFNLDPAAAGTSGRIKAAALDITNADVTINAPAALDDAVYILADYTSLNGTQFAAVTPLTGNLAGYTINYAYNGGTQIALVSALTGYDLWASNNAEGQAANLDFDNDGVANGVEYFMGQTGSTFTPTPTVVDGKVTWPYDATTTGITYRVLSSIDLSSWDPVSPQPVPSGGRLEYVLPTTGPKLFVRLEVVKTP